MTDEDKKRLRDLATKITSLEFWREAAYPGTGKEIEIRTDWGCYLSYFGTIENRDFALLAIQNVLDLLDEIDRLRAERDDLLDQKARWEYYP